MKDEEWIIADGESFLVNCRTNSPVGWVVYSGDKRLWEKLFSVVLYAR